MLWGEAEEVKRDELVVKLLMTINSGTSRPKCHLDTDHTSKSACGSRGCGQ
jgi:hypothetical protein